jgi:tellurite resistance protein
VLVILGPTPVTRTRGRGDFFCPECGGRRPYARQRVQKRFALFFVSVLPLDELGEYVECQACRGTFRTTVLDHGPEHVRDRFQAEFRAAVLRIMLLMMMVDGRVEPSEKRMIIDLNQRLTGRALTMDDLEEHLRAIADAGMTALDFARTAAPLLNDPGKEMVLKAAYAVAVADGRVHPAERTLFHSLGRALAMSPGHIRAVLMESAALATELLGTGGRAGKPGAS